MRLARWGGGKTGKSRGDNFDNFEPDPQKSW